MKAYGRANAISATFGSEWSASCPSCFTSGEGAPGTHWIGGWVGPRTSLDNMKKKRSYPCWDLYPVTIPTVLSWHSCSICNYKKHERSIYRMSCSGCDCLCGLVVRVAGRWPRGPGFDSWRYQIFLVAVGIFCSKKVFLQWFRQV
jgi:hypothetical protein